jgi:hypothetical protein
VNKYRSMHSLQCVTGGGGGFGYVESIFRSNTRPDSEPIKLLYHPKKIKEGRGPQIDKHLPPSTFTGQFLRKADI